MRTIVVKITLRVIPDRHSAGWAILVIDRFVDEIIADEFGSPDLELAWLSEDDNDAGKSEAALESRVKLGAVTLNEMRGSLGLDPYANAAADRPMVLTASGYVPIEANAGGNGANAQTIPAVQKYNTDEPRVPKGNPGAGRWTGESESTPGTPGVRYAGPPTPYEIDPSALTGISQIDDVTKKLSEILANTINKLGLLPGSPQNYGIVVHLEFAAAVIAEAIRGISPFDVERTFRLPPSYGSQASVRPDVVLRNDIGDIIAVYDVKTLDAALKPGRVNQLRAAIGIESTVPVIDLHIERGPTLKFAESVVQRTLRIHDCGE